MRERRISEIIKLLDIPYKIVVLAAADKLLLNWNIEYPKTARRQAELQAALLIGNTPEDSLTLRPAAPPHVLPARESTQRYAEAPR